MARLLLIDIGNTRIKWAIKDSDGLTVAAPRIHRGHVLSEILDMDWLHLKAPDRVLVSCVAAESVRISLTQWLERHWQLHGSFLTSSAQECGVKNAYSQPESLGSDRWAGMIAAYQQVRDAVCVVNAGTALTIDVLRSDGMHMGGLIFPGVYSLQHVLFSQTALKSTGTSEVTLDTMLGKSTQECIDLGLRHALAALFVRLSMYLKNEIGKQPHYIVTGGDAEIIRKVMPVETQYEPYLVLHGLSVLTKA